MNWRITTLVAAALGLALLRTLPGLATAGGALDPSFDGDGRVTTDVSGPSDWGRALVVQPDGKIVVVGSSVARYESSGALDTTFADDGLSGLSGQDVALQDDGKIVVVGGNKVVRLTTDGAPDTSFGGDGTAGTPVLDDLHGVAIQGDGKIVGVGEARFAGAEGRTTVRAGMVRWNEDGTRDASFSGNGIRLFTAGRGSSAEALAIQPNGKIVIAGSAQTSRGNVFLLFRVLANGDSDRSFGAEGAARTRFGANDEAADVVLQADGKIVVAGSSAASGNTPRQLFERQDFALARYTTHGRLDVTFSHDGKRLTDFAGGRDQAGGLAIQPDGRVVVAGITSPANRPVLGRFGLARYNPTGTLDSSFGDGGTRHTRFGPSARDYGWDMAVQPDGAVVVVGAVTAGDTHFDFDVGVARYLAH